MRQLQLALLAAALSGHATMARPAEREPALSTVTTTAARHTAELSYRFFLGVQYELHQHMPPEPHLVDLWYRLTYPEMREPERDAFVPPAYAISMHAKSVRASVPMRRGAYFSLPAIQDAYDEDAALVISDVIQPWLGVWWTLRVPDSQRMAYGDIRRARAQITTVQGKISAFSHPYLKNVKREPYDGIKACFHDDSGAILVDGKAVADATEGRCKLLFSEPGRIADSSSVAFSGPLDVVSFIDRSYYR